MLTAVPTSFWSREYLLHREDGQVAAHVKVNWGWKEAGSVTVGETFLEIERDGWTGPWLVRSQGQVLATIVKPSAFSRAFEIIWNQVCYALEPRTLSSSFDLSYGTRGLGSLERYGLVSRKMSVNLLEEVPLALQAIAVWIVLLMWNRGEAVSGS
jgi:hypothetical protein